MKMFYRNCILFVILFCLIFNVKAEVCTYKINGYDYSLQYDVKYGSEWFYAYSFNGNSSTHLFNENAGQPDSSFNVYSPNKTEFLNSFNSQGFNWSYASPGSCPVLVSTGGNNYTLMSLDFYNKYFLYDEIFNCDGCGDVIKLKSSYSSREDSFTFENICTGLKYHSLLYPVIEYVRINSDYNKGDLIYRVCSSGSGMHSGTKLKDLFKGFEDDFITGVSTEFDDSCSAYNKSDTTISDIVKCLTEKGEKVDSAILEFNKACSENEMRSIQSYASGSLVKFYEKGKISPYLNNEIKLLFNSFSSDCGAAADELYNVVNNLSQSLYLYYNNSQINNKLSYMYVESKYLSGYGLLTSINPVIKATDNTCNLISPQLKNIIKDILNVLRMGGVVITIFLSIVEVYKVVFSNDDGAKKKMSSLIMKRLIALVVILLLPVIVMIFIDFLNQFIPVDSNKCIIDELK